MKKLSIYTLLCCLAAACTFSLNSCQEFNIDSQTEFPPKIEIDAQAEYAVLAKAPHTIVFNISSNTPWKIESNKNWCVPTPAMSAASSLIAEVSVNIEENPDGQERTATLTITADGVKENQTITITQAAKGSLLVQGFDDPFPSDGGEAAFTITSNKPWKVTSSNQWLTLSKEEGEGNGEKVIITATAKANTGLKRTATLTITSDGYETEVVATQNGIMLEFPEMTPEEATLSSEAGEMKAFSVLTNLSSDKWDVSTEDSWINVNKNAAGDGIEITVKSEIYFKDRTAIIRLEADKTLGIDPVELEVKQNRGAIAWPENAIYENGAESGVKITQSRFYPNKHYKLATFEVTFNEVNLTKDAVFFQFYKDESIPGSQGPTINCWMGDNDGNGSYDDLNDFCLRTRDNWGDNGNINTPNKLTGLDVNKLNAMKTLKFSLIPNPDITGNVLIQLDIDGTNYATIGNLKNPFVGAGSTYAGNFAYFGFLNGKASGTLDIASFEVTPIDFEE